MKCVFWLVVWVGSISEPFEYVSWDIGLTSEAVFCVLEIGHLGTTHCHSWSMSMMIGQDRVVTVVTRVRGIGSEGAART